MGNIADFGVGGNNPAAIPLSNTFESMYAQSVDAVLHGTGNETFEAVKMLKSADPRRYQPARGANYPRGRFGDSLRQTAQLLKANLGVEIAFTDVGGWDHHVNEGSTQGQLANLLREFSQSLAAFWIDLGDLAEDTVIVTMSEFGRTARENGNRGTDHGHANAMFVVGNGVRGGKIYGQWPGLRSDQLNEGRDLALTTDFRDVYATLLALLFQWGVAAHDLEVERIEAGEKRKLGEIRYKGGERACIIFEGDHDPIVDIVVWVTDGSGKEVARYDRGGDIGAVIWYPPQEDTYTLWVHNPGAEFNKINYAFK